MTVVPSAAGPAIHGSTVAVLGPSGWRGVLLTGPSGAGKSDLALRLIASGARLVADDYSLVWSSSGAAWAGAPERIAGRIEIRSLGVVEIASRPFVRLALVVACGQAPVERMPEPAFETVAGIALPRLDLDTRPASAALVVARALRQF